MPKSAKPRKAYRPRLTFSNAHQLSIEAVTVLNDSEVEQAASAPEAALDAFHLGIEPAFQWAVMADALNVAEALCDRGICSDDESRNIVLRGQEALAQVYGNWSPTPGETYDLEQAVARHRLQLTFCDYSEYRKAMADVTRKCAGAKAGNAPAGAIVYDSTIQP